MGQSRYSMVDLEEPDLEWWPRFAEVRGSECVLEPGDALFLPSGWFAHAEDISAESLTVAIDLREGANSSVDPRSKKCAQQLSRNEATGCDMPIADEAVIPRVGRQIERRVADSVGVEGSKDFLEMVAEARDAKMLDLATVQVRAFVPLPPFVGGATSDKVTSLFAGLQTLPTLAGNKASR